MAKAPTAPAAHHRVLVLHGKDPFLRTLKLTHLREAVEATGVETDVIRFDGAATPLADILDECRSFGLLQQHKIVVVDQADQLLKDKEDAPARQPRARDLVQAYAEAPCESATLVLRAETWHRGKIDKAIAKVGAVIKCEPPNPARAADWAVARAAKRHGATLERPAAAALIEQTGPALGRIDAELAKLATAAGPGAPITVALVNELVGFSREQTVWHIQETVLRADPERILRELGELLTVSRVPEILVRYALSDLARKVHAATAGRAGGTPPGQIDAALKLWGSSKSMIHDAAARLTPEAAAGLLHEAVQADARAKSSSGDEIRGVETLALRFASVLGS